MRSFTAHDFLPGPCDDVEFAKVHVHREHSGGRITDSEAFAIGGDPVGVRHFNAKWYRYK